MIETDILVPVRYPLKEPSTRTVTCAHNIAQREANAHLHILYVNLLHRRKYVTREQLQCAVEAKVGSLQDASYHVRYAYLLEEAILEEIVEQDIDYVVLGTSRKRRWYRRLRRLLDLDPDLETVLRQQVDVKIITPA